jgi:hypothetical protein
MSTLRISNIEAKADISNPIINEKVKITNSSGKVLVQVDGSNAGITTVGINTTSTSFTVDNNQNFQFVGGLSSNSINTSSINNGPLAGTRNRIINGDMRIDQRNAGASIATSSGTSVFTVDRWRAGYTQTSKFTAQQNAGSVTAPASFTNYLGVASSSAYSVLTGDAFWLHQRVEGFNVADLSWGTANAQTITVSFWVRSSLTGTFGGSVFNDSAVRSYPFTYTVSATNTWEKKTVTIAGDTSGTWLINNGTGLQINFALGVGSTFSGTAGAWAGSALYSVTGATSVVGTNGATFYITGVQLEPGTVATPFEQRPIGTELALCQRYYCKTFPVTTAPVQNSPAGGPLNYISQTTTASTDVGWRFPVEMRLTPSVVTTYSTNANSANWSTNTDTPTASLFYQGSTGLAVRASASGAVGRGYSIHVSAEAEL